MQSYNMNRLGFSSCLKSLNWKSVFLVSPSRLHCAIYIACLKFLEVFYFLSVKFFAYIFQKYNIDWTENSKTIDDY